MKLKQKQDLEDERELRQLSRAIERQGLSVRRENLTRGTAFKVKSGTCNLSGKALVFVDRRLPRDQQRNILVDRLLELRGELQSAELENLSASTRALLERRTS